ncbi:MAG: nucleotidyltransferase family protein, partial [Pseudomonadota bacterium]
GRIAFRQANAAPYVFTGLQVLKTALVEIGPDGPFSTRVLWQHALERGRLFGAVHHGDWMHVGDPQGLAAAEARLKGAAG